MSAPVSKWDTKWQLRWCEVLLLITWIIMVAMVLRMNDIASDLHVYANADRSTQSSIIKVVVENEERLKALEEVVYAAQKD